ncbi:MAG: hypothetical protein IKT98_05485 [Selenomonadaceae bacterium]|nr:hypothetical protein [Selenomonadaceae bacterium]
MKFDLQRFADLTITKGGTYNVNESNSTITIATTEAVTLTGNADTQLSEVVISTTADNANLTIDNLNIANNINPIITVGDGSENKLNITGKNTLEIKSGPGACVNIGGGLTVNGTGSFKGTSINSAVIGINGTQSKPDSDITIESGTFNLTCRSGACAIGGAGARGNAVGNITITGTANITASAPGGHAATIGASYWGTCGDITINGDAKITATSGQHSSAIGGASLASVGNIMINGNAEVNAINASQVDDSAAIGSGLGSMVQSLGNIVIGGNAKVTATSNLGLAIDNIEYHRENQQYGTTNEGDYYLDNEDTITIGENATFTGHSGDIYTKTTINGTEFKAAEISYNSTDGLLYSGGSELDKEALEETLLEINKGGSYTIAEGSVGKILINTTDAVTLQGGDYDLEEIQIIAQSDTVDLTINDLKITNKAVAASVIHLGSGADNKLTINGANDFSIVKGNKAGINIGGGGTIGGTGSIKIVTLNGAAIGTNGEEDLSSSNITIDSGTFDLMTRSGACGIGCAGNGSKIGNITITGTAHVVSNTPQGYAAAIGSAYRGTVGDILINGDATVEATSGLQTAAIGSAVYCKNGNITIGGRASVVANTTSTDVKDAAIGGTYGEQVNSIGDINIIEDATVIANSAHGLALDNRLFIETENYINDYWTVNADSTISISGDTSTPNQSTVILTNGNNSDIVTIGNRAYQGDKMVFYDGNLAMTGNWTSLESGGWGYSSVVQMDYLQKNRDDKSAQFTLKGGNLKDEDGDGAPDNVSIGSILYVQQSGTHTNIRNLSGNVIYNGDALGIEGDDSYNIEAVSPIDLSEEFPLEGYYITDANVTAIRAVSDGATISPRGTAGTSTAADWISFDNKGDTVTFKDGSYCLYTEKQFFSRAYTKLSISNNNEGVEITTGDDLIKTIGNLQDGYEITIESGINVGEKIDFKTSGAGVIVVKTTANSGKYSLDADSDEWQYQRYTLGSDSEFTFVFGENGSVVGVEGFDSTLQTDDNSLFKGEWATLDGGGFEYTGNATNNPSKSATFTVSGDSITSTDNLTIANNIYVEAQGGNRIAINGLNGNAFVDDTELGISGDSNYAAHFTKSAAGIGKNIVLMNVSDGATVRNNYSASVDKDAQITFGDGLHTIFTNKYMSTQNYTTIAAENGGNGFTLNIVDDKFETISGLSSGYELNITAGGNIGDSLAIQTDGKTGTITVGDETFTVNGDEEFGLKFNEDSVELVDYEGWTTISSGVYNYVSDSLDFTVEASDINWDVFRIGKKVVPLGDDAYQIALASIGGSVKVNGVDMGIYNDDKYTIHVYVYPNTAAPADIATNISDGASVEASYDTLIIDDNAKVHISDGKRVVVMGMHYVNKDFTSIDVENGGNGFYLQSLNDKFTTFAGLSNDFNISIEPGGNIGDEVTFETDGGQGTINVGDTTLEVDGDEEFSILLDDSGNLKGLKNFDGSATVTSESDDYEFGTNIGLALQHKTFVLQTEADSAVATLANSSDSIEVHYVNNTAGGIIDLSDKTLNNAFLLAQGASATLIGSKGDDQFIGIATTVNQTGGEGADTFRGGYGFQTINIEDYNEDEDAVYHGSSFELASPLSLASLNGDDFAMALATVQTVIHNGADKKIKVIDTNGKVAYIGNYWTVADYDADTITAFENVKVLDATERTTDVELIGNDGDNTILGGGYNATMDGGDGNDLLSAGTAVNMTMTGGAGNDTFRGGANLAECVITDYTEGEDVIYHGRPFADMSINGSIVGSDYVFEAVGKKIIVKNGAEKIIKGVDVNGDERLFGKYLTLDDNDPATITAQDGVATIDPSERTKDIEIIGNDGDNTIYSGSGNDLIVYNGGNDVINGFTANDTLSIAGGKYSASVSGNDLILTVGDDSITLEDAATLNNPNIIGTEKMSTEDIIKEFKPNHSSVVSAEDTGKKDISLTGGDLAVVEKTSAKVSIVTSKSTDTVVSEGENVTVNLKSGGNTWLFVPEGKMTLEGYNDTTGAGFNDNYDDMLSEIVDKILSKEISFDDGKLSMGAAVVSFGNVTSEIVNFYDAEDGLQKVGFASDDAAINASNKKDDLILIGGIASTLLGGSGNDTVYASDESFIDAGAGKNIIELNGDNATIQLSNGRNTIVNFTAGFDDDGGDKISVDATTANFSFDGTDLIVKNGATRALLENISSGDGTARILTVANGKEIKTAIAQKDSIIAVNDDNAADIYIGNKSGVDFTNFEESLIVDLTDGKSFRGINQVTVGGGLNTLIASSANETLTGNDNGTTEFVFDKGNGRDVIKNFNFEEDKINVGTNAITAVNLNDAGAVRMQIGGDGWITLEDAQGKNFKINEFVAKVDENITYDDAANYFVATAKNAKVTVADEAEIWLDGSHGKYFVGDIKTLDATISDGKNTLAGNEIDNTILAGKGDASLWGGNGGDDLLVGGNSQNLFFYCNGNGNDTIRGTNDGDGVILAGISLDQIVGTKISGNAVDINFKDGGSLHVEGNSDITYQLADGLSFSANHEQAVWLSK